MAGSLSFGAAPPAAAAPHVAADAHRADRPLRWALLGVIVAVALLPRFGLRLAGHPFDASLLASYALLAVMLWTGRTQLDVRAAVLYAIGAAGAVLSLLVNLNFASTPVSATSLALLVAIYLPFAFVIAPARDPQALWRWTVGAFSHVALIVALAGIVQFFAQFVFDAPWLFDFRSLLPWKLQGPGGYNTVIPVGEVFKSNGFFMREPSHFSFLMALAILVELNLLRRWWRIVLFGFALLLTYSGTGILALLIGLLFPLGRRTLIQLAVLAVAGAVIVGVLGEALNLGFTLGRVAEFGSERSSAYIRYIAPLKVLADGVSASPWAFWLGQGPGTIQRTAQDFQFFDPTWAKLTFEYGVIGAFSVISLVVGTMLRWPAPQPMRAALLMGWLIMGGHLLSPDSVALLYVLLCGWSATVIAAPSRRRPS